MTYIYADNLIEGVDGAYVAPFRFCGVEKGITKVHTADERIANAYRDAGVEVVFIGEELDKTPIKRTRKKRDTVSS